VKAVFFDLDYTLYDQRQYLLGSLAAVAERIAASVGREASELTASLRAVWEREGTDCPDLFDRWLRAEGLLDPRHVRMCVETFHDFAPLEMEPFPSTLRVLEALRERYRTGIITDGHATMQRSKIAALGLAARVDRVFLPYEHRMKKPDPQIFRQVLREEGLEPHQMLYVGDHPIKDIMAASQAGLPTVRTLTGEFASLPDHPECLPTYRVEELSEVLLLVERAPVPPVAV
jgi:putative hydrolase of the HAD superfamily